MFPRTLSAENSRQLALAAFRNAFKTSAGNANYVSYLDFDNSGVIDHVDLAQFRQRSNSTVFI